MAAVLTVDHTDDLRFLHDYELFHVYQVGDGAGKVEAYCPAHLATVLWYRDTPEKFQVVAEIVKVGQRSTWA